MNLVPTPPQATGGSTSSIDHALKALCRVSELTESQFGAFRRFYDTVRPEVRPPKSDGQFVINIDRMGLQSNESVVEAVEKLRCGCEITAEAFLADAFPNRVNQEKAVRQTVKLAYLIDPASQDDYPNGFRFENEPIFPVKWELKQTFKDFFNAAFPITNTQDVWTASSKQMSLRAWKLRQRLKLQIVRTDDLAEHLVYNPQTKSLAVFHQVEWLKAQIHYTRDRKLDEAVEVSLTTGSLPPQLLVETLYTIYAILFPIGTDKKSRRIAERLVQAKFPFDPDLLTYKRSDHSISTDFKYLYWSKRLRTLQNLVETRPPKNRITSWFERHTSERNALTVAIIGLFLSVLFGFLGLLVGIAQVIISILAWKHPTQSSSG